MRPSDAVTEGIRTLFVIFIGAYMAYALYDNGLLDPFIRILETL